MNFSTKCWRGRYWQAHLPCQWEINKAQKKKLFINKCHELLKDNPSTSIAVQETHFRDEDGYADIATSVHVHEALEIEFGIEIKDKLVLITDIETAFYIVTSHHDPLWLIYKT